MTITAKIIADSISEAGVRLTTVQLRYPLIIHGELMTHRVFSRNASSNRAIPVKRLIDDVLNDPYVPSVWGLNKPGMQAEGALSDDDAFHARSAWMDSLYVAVAQAKLLDQMGVHKQHVNRLLMPFQHINVIVTATEWDNFFELRDHPDAQPEIQQLAREIRKAREASTPKLLLRGEWHLPYVTDDDWHSLLWSKGEDAYAEGAFEVATDLAIRVSVARCARVSYMTHEGKKPTLEQDLKLYDDLVGARPLHASPAEHQATPDRQDIWGKWFNPELHGNLRGWLQYRKRLEQEVWAEAA